MKKFITVLAVLTTFLLFSCENIINKPNTTSLTFSFPEEVNRHISDTLLSSRSFTLDTNINISATLLNKDKTIENISKNTTLNDLGNVSFLFDNLSFSSNYKVSIDISYKGSSIYKGLSSNINVSESSLNPVVDIDINPIESTITYNLNGGELNSSYPKKYFVLSNVILPIPTSEYKTFNGWITEKGEKVTELGKNNFLGNITLTATWIDNPKVGAITFSSPSLLDKDDLITLTCLAFPDASIYYTTDDSTPSKNSTLYKEPIRFTKDVTIKAIAYKEGMIPSNVYEKQYKEKTYTVTFKTSIGNAPEPITGLIKNQTLTSNQLSPLKDSENEFLGWFNGNDKVTTSTPITQDTELIARWKAYNKLPDVTFSTPSLLDKDELITLSCLAFPDALIYYTTDDSTPNKNSTLYKDPISIQDDITIKAIAYKEGMKESNVSEMSYTVKKYNVTFDTNGKGGASIENLTNVPKGYPVKLEPLSENGYNFDGWIDSKGKAVDDSYTVYETTTITASWSPISYTINYMNCDKTVKNDNPLSYTIEDDIKLNPPMKTGFTFNGWYTTETFDENSSIRNIKNRTGQLTLWAKWDAESYNITYVGIEGATNNNPTSYNATSPEIRLLDPSRNGYTFIGWFSDEQHTISDTTIPPNSTGDKTFYAKWEIITYSISYQTSEGVPVTLDSSPIRHSHVSPPTEFNVNSPSLTLYPPAKDGYTGVWMNEGVETSTIPSGTYNHITLTVGDVWNPIKYYINFNANGGSGDMPRQEITYGVRTPLNDNKFTYEGYKWEGWQTGSTGGSIKTDSYNECVNNGASIDVYAKWVEAIPPDEVTNLKAITDDTSIQLNWTNPSSSDLAYVNITCTSHPDIVIPQQRAVAGMQGSCTVSSLTNGTEYTFKITTEDSNKNISNGKEIKQYPMLPLHLQDEPIKKSASSYPTTYRFGVYPQTIKAKGVNVSQTTTSILNWECYYGSDGNYYVKGTPEKNCKGKTFSDGTPMTFGTDYYFKLEPITWINSTYRPKDEYFGIMYYTEKLIYNSVWGEPSINDPSSGESVSTSRNTYPTSIVSDKLNSEFSSKGFSPEMIQNIYEDDTLKNILAGRTEKFWLMDFRDYNDRNRAFNNDQDRDAVSTDYAFLMDTYNDGNTVNDVVQGTRDFNEADNTVGFVNSDGTVPSSTTGPVNEVYPYRVATFFKINP